MSSEDVHVSLVRGDGVVSRRGVGLMVVLPGGSDDVRDELLGAFDEACTEGDTPGRTMARRLVGLLSQHDPEQLPPFGACAPNERGWAVILHQGVAMHVSTADGAEMISGYDASTWVDRIIGADFESLAMLADGVSPPDVGGRFRLDSGVVPGSGATIIPRAAAPTTDAAAPVAAEPSEPMSAEVSAEPASDTESTPDPAEAAPEPQESPQPAPAMADAEEVAPSEPSPAPQPVATVPEEPPVGQDLPDRPPVADRGGGQSEPSGLVGTPAAPPDVEMPDVAAAGAFVPTPTPTGNPGQQGVFDATPASQDIPRRFTDPAPAGQVGGESQPDPDEEEPPTLIQAPNREAAEPAALEHSPEPEAMPAADVAFESVPLTDIDPSGRREALPVLTVDTPKEETEDSDAPLVHGVMSPAGYFNHPDALYCAVTGVAMLHRTHVLVERPRPPLGVVVADDGSTFTLSSGYVVGREPERDPLVASDDARPLKLQDAERSLSRVHAEIRLQDWDVFVVDRGSANGTYVLPRGAQQWKRLVADVEEKVVPGTRIAFGKRVVTYESHHQINQAAS